MILKYLTETKNHIALLNATWAGLFLGAFEKYVFADWETFGFLMVLIGVDTAFGFIKHWKLKTISSKGWGRFGGKVLLYFGLLVSGHVASHVGNTGFLSFLGGWYDGGIKAYIIIRELISLLENAAVIWPDRVPVWILKRLKEFDAEGKYLNNTTSNQ